MSKKREVVILSDLLDFFDESFFTKIIKSKHIHCFQLVAPLDENEQKPFSFFGISSINKKKTGYHKLDTVKGKIYENILGKRLKKIRVKERYLEEFVKEML